MAITRLGPSGHGTRRTGSFAGKGSSAHPVGVLTRLGSGGYGARRCGSFADKGTSSSHPVGRITRLGFGGYGVRRAGSFVGKTAGQVVTPPSVVEQNISYSSTRRRPPTQFVLLSPFEEADRYATLRLYSGLHSTLSSFDAGDLYGGLNVTASLQARLIGDQDVDRYASVEARYGLPDLAVLVLLLGEIANDD